DEGTYEGPAWNALRSWRPYVENALSNREKRYLLPLYLCGSCIEWLAADARTAEFTVSMFGKRLYKRFAELGAHTLNPEMVPLLRDVADSCYPGWTRGDMPHTSWTHLMNFFSHYAPRRPQDISWEEECATLSRRNGLYVHLLTLFTVLLDRNLYVKDHREALEKLNGPFKTILARSQSSIHGRMLCGSDIEYLCVLPSNFDSTHCLRAAKWIVTIRTRNAYLKGLLTDFLQEDDAYAFHPTDEKVDVLVRGLGEAADKISRPEDFTASLFWRQAQLIREEYAEGTRGRVKNAAFLRGFYQYLTDLEPERDLFENATNLSTELIHSGTLTHYIANDYLVTSFCPGIDLGDAERVALILRGYDDLSTCIVSEDSVQLDLSTLTCPFYRQELLAFACRSSQTLISAAQKQVPHASRAMQSLYEAKRKKGYPNPCLDKITRAEVSLIREAVERLALEPGTKSALLTSIRAFFRWERDARKRIDFEDFALDSLTGISHVEYKNSARAVPREHLALISSLLSEKARDSLEWMLANAVFHLLLQTEFRVGQICHLDVGCVRPTAKPNEHVIRSTSKTSKGEKEQCVITQRTLDVLNGAIDATEDVRRRFAKRSTSRYVFIYQNERQKLRRMSTQRFSKMLIACCKDLGIDPPYTANNLRDTHETLAVRISTSADGEVSPRAPLLTGHTGIRMAYAHYVDIGIEEMIAATFDVYIGDNLQVDADGKVVEVIPEEARGEDRVVEGGCGCCTAQYCSVTSPLPCLVCESFVTTIDHEPFFVRAMETVDAQLQHAASRHDAEDLTTIKRLLAAFLAAIYRKKEETEKERESHE
ncbi:MAG: tyrosine-type recombinase/integrase, partial [Coriobacteriales bacterium]